MSTTKAYFNIIDNINDGCHYLWGPIHNALLLEFIAGKQTLILDLLFNLEDTDDFQILVIRRDILLQVLLSASRENLSLTKHFLDEVLEFTKESKQHNKSIGALMIVARMAGELQLTDILLQLVFHKSSRVRRTAVSTVASMYTEDSASVLQIIDTLQSKIVGKFGSVNRNALQSCLEISLSVLFSDFNDLDLYNNLGQSWAKVINKLTNIWWIAGIDRFIFKTIFLKLIVHFVLLKLLNDFNERVISNFDIREIKAFFDSPAIVKERFKKVLPYIHFDYGSLASIKSELQAIVRDRDMLSSYLMLIILVIRLNQNPEETSLFIKDLFDEGMEISPPTISVNMLITAMSSQFAGQSGTEINSKLLAIEKEMIQTYHEKYLSIGKGNLNTEYVYSGMSSYIQLAYLVHSTIDTDLIDTFVDPARKESGFDDNLIRNYLANIIQPEALNVWPILECLSPIMSILASSEEQNGATLKEDFINALARLHTYDAEKVHLFLDMSQTPQDTIQVIVNRSTPEEVVSAIIGNGILFVRAMILSKSHNRFLTLLEDWFDKATTLKNMNQWLSYGINLLIDEVKGFGSDA